MNVERAFRAIHCLETKASKPTLQAANNTEGEGEGPFTQELRILQNIVLCLGLPLPCPQQQQHRVAARLALEPDQNGLQMESTSLQP